MSSERKQLRKLLFVAMRYDYGRREQGLSFEFTNFYQTLIKIVPTVIEFDFMSLMQVHGKERMNTMLIETANREKPDLIFFILFTDEFLKDTLAKLTENYTTFNWFCDDHWRFSNFSKYFAPLFSFVSTTDKEALPKYDKLGYKKALLTQWACNHYDYVRGQNVERTLDVTFVGQPHGNRKKVIKYLQQKGLNIQAYGRGWQNGRVTQEQMIRIFNTSKINLNLSNSSWNIRTFFRRQEQIKGRNFEIPGCGGFLLTNSVEGLEEYYVVGKEIICFENKRDLVDKASFYLNHDVERDEIALRGYERTLRDHTYEKRFKEIFTQMGFVL